VEILPKLLEAEKSIGVPIIISSRCNNNDMLKATKHMQIN
jgi:hypothetical protein